jgi:tRNA modification GTPase
VNFDDTIGAIATAPGEAGISIVRISGPEAHTIAKEIFVPSSGQSVVHGTFCHGHVTDKKNSVHIDEVLLMTFNAPHSYTREDVIEIQCHGGSRSAQAVLRAVLDAGARPADPGEFTQRAFLNGRIDLLQAEAVLDLIRARSDRAAGAAMQQLDGRLSDCIGGTYTSILSAAGDLEASLDFPEEGLPDRVMPDILSRLQNGSEALAGLLDSWGEGHILRDGALLIICGRPNVGKSTLLNSLLQQDRAIVTDLPGTTRDSIEEQFVLDGIPLRLVDTAGLRESDCPVEQEGISRAQDLIAAADIVLYVIDGSSELHADDMAEIGRFSDKKTIILLNKSDLGTKITSEDLKDHKTIACSLLADAVPDSLTSAILESMDLDTSTPPHAVISERHRTYVQTALNELNEALGLLRGNACDVAVVCQSLRTCLQELGLLTGRTYSDDLLDSIFSRFCIGK